MQVNVQSERPRVIPFNFRRIPIVNRTRK